MQQEFDRRAQERMAVNTETKCTFVSPVLEDFGPGRIHNISMDGLALLLTSRVQPGTLMAVTLVNEARGFQKTVMLRVEHATVQGGACLVGGSFSPPLTYQELTALVM